MNNKSDILTSSKFLFILLKNNVAIAAFSYLLSILLANHLGPEKFGIYTHILIVGSLVSIFINFCTDQTAAVLSAEYDDFSRVFNEVYLLRILVSVPVFAIVAIFLSQDLLFFVFVLCLSIANYNLSFLYEVLDLNARYSYIFLLEKISYISIVCVTMFFFNLDISHLFFVFCLVTFGSILFQLYDQSTFVQLKLENTKILLFRNFKENGPLLIAALSVFAYGGFSRLIIERNLGSEQLGIYSVGWQFIAIGTVFQGQVARLWRVNVSTAVLGLNTENLYRTLFSYLLLSTLPMLLMGLLLVYLGDDIIAILFDRKYAEAAVILPAIGLYIVVVNLGGFVDMLWVAIRKSFTYMLVNLISGGLLVLILFLYASDFDLVDYVVAALLCHGLSYFLLVLVWIRVFRQRLNNCCTT